MQTVSASSPDGPSLLPQAERRAGRGGFAACGQVASQRNGGRALRWEISLFVVLLVAFNVPLLLGNSSTRFAFHPGTVWAGEWWRLLTYPWVHVSWYHLALDATAFLLAYAELGNWRVRERLGCVAAAAMGSVLTALGWSPLVYLHGLAGLSGIAHGLTAVASLQAATRERSRLLQGVGWVGFAATIVKCLIEVSTGQVMFASWHLGWLGTPIAGAHLGGVLGALLVWWWRKPDRDLYRLCENGRRPTQTDRSLQAA
jgi:membrane associated rhomboid family serine protease